jgi:hypothetical protein
MDIVLFLLLVGAVAGCIWLWTRLRQQTAELVELADRAERLDAAMAAVENQAATERGRAEAALVAKQMAEGAVGKANDELRQARFYLDTTTEELEEARQRLGDTSAELDEVRSRLGTAITAATEARARAETARAEAETAQAEVERTSAQATDQTQRARAARAEVTRLKGELTARSDALPPAALWTLELARSERTWRNSVATGPSSEPPFATAEDPLRVAVEVEVAALREEVGADINLDWRIEQPLPTTVSFTILRGAQEVLAAAAKTVDGGTLVAESGDDASEVLITLTNGDDPDGEVIDLTIPPFAGSGIEPVVNGVRVKIPAVIPQPS